MIGGYPLQLLTKIPEFSWNFPKIFFLWGDIFRWLAQKFLKGRNILLKIVPLEGGSRNPKKIWRDIPTNSSPLPTYVILASYARGPHCTLRETWKKPKSQNWFKIWILVIDCTVINKLNMILSFENAMHWFLMVKVAILLCT